MDLLQLILLSTFLSVSVTSESFHAMEDEALVVKCPQDCQNRTVKWYHTQTNQLIPAEEGGRIHSSGRFLWFLPTSKEDSGNYTCVTHYSNYTKQSTVSVMVYLHKQGICFPSQIRYPNDTGTLTSGRIVCPTIDNYEKATIVKWYKDCKPLQGPREKYSMGGKYLFIKRPQKTDEGHYTCHFTCIHSGNIYNVSATRIFRVKEDVSSPMPSQIQYPTDNAVIQVESGSPVNISCGAFLGIGKQNIAVVTWEVNGIKAEYLNTSRFHEDHQFFMRGDRGYYGESILTIEEVKEEDLLSNFTCTALNEIDHVMVTVTLQLKVPCKGDNHSTYTTIGILVLLSIIALLLILYQFFRIDIVLLCQRIFKPYKTQDDAANALEMRIQKSRRLIIILTPQLIQCEEFGYEHQIALYSALIQNNIKVILLEMETIGNYAGLQESLRYIIKQQGTIKWKEKHKECPHASNSKFWKLVRYHMPLIHKPSQLNHAV
ncbi:interleukin-1 receptor-like 1 isoform X3 [Malaclemys terrapin pileata]|uniref:interleukin-1 receptor-like 1 isoform X3 n=1 Tax=Malaclemys terrapin pileata TaxID=2991368 RepID=UPI0023A861AE|nr:interleukin-1 receptor-like 1 isoform X3 [Malaclemys terrapin pileata]